MASEKNIIIACSGSVAAMKLPNILSEILKRDCKYKINIKVIVTERAKHFVDLSEIRQTVTVLDDDLEWSSWNKRGDPVLHIELGKWADLIVIAPLSANSLSKVATGLCDNLLLCVLRAWDFQKPIIFCPAMNTRMYEHPITQTQISILKNWGYQEIPCISKTLMCGDTGLGGMAEVDTILSNLFRLLNNE